MKKSLTIILQGTPENVEIDEIRMALKKIQNIKNIHDCHLWTMDGQYYVLTLHAVIDELTDLDQQAAIKTEIKKVLKNYDIDHATIEFEAENEFCEFETC